MGCGWVVLIQVEGGVWVGSTDSGGGYGWVVLIQVEGGVWVGSTDSGGGWGGGG